MPTPPDDIPVWATSAAAGDIEEPEAATVASGWPAALPPPHEWVNWWWNRVGQWLAYLDKTTRVFSTLDAAMTYADANLVRGDFVIVHQDDTHPSEPIGAGPGREVATVATGSVTNHIGAIDTSGDLVVWCYGTGTPVAYDVDLGDPVATYTRTNSGTNYAIRTDGTTTYVAYDQYVEAFNATTGASLWVWDADGACYDLALMAGVLYVVHDRSGGAGDATANRHLHALDVSGASPSTLWSFQHASAGGALENVATNGRQVFVSGPASDFASAATLRALVASNGFDATGEANNGDDTTGLAWDSTVANVAGTGGNLDCDGFALYVGFSSSATHQVRALSAAFGEVVWELAIGSGLLCSGLCVDQDYVFASMTAQAHPPELGYTVAIDKRSSAIAWLYGRVDTGTLRGTIDVVSDGTRVYTIGDDDDQVVRRLTRGNVPTRYRVVDLDDAYVTVRNLRLQPERL